MRVILDERADGLACGRTLSDDLLADLYAVPGSGRWLRATMVSTIDGSATGDRRWPGIQHAHRRHRLE